MSPVRARAARRVLGAATAAVLALGCGGQAPPASTGAPSTGAGEDGGAREDLLGPRPAVAEVAPFTPPVPEVYTRPDGVTVWLLERHELPLVGMTVVLPYGGADDPPGKAGLAWMTANMLDEGAGARDAVALSEEVERLGASLSTGAYADYSAASLVTLRATFDEASALLGDVVLRPRFAAADFARTKELWLNDLKARARDPEAVASLVAARTVYGEGHPYGLPTSGTEATAPRVALADVRAFHAAHARLDVATIVVVGDVKRADLDAALDRAFAGARKPKGPPPARRPLPEPPAPARRIVLVDRPDAPQAVVLLVRPGVAGGDADAAGLFRVNAALGGTFSSRLNQDLREERGLTYGAHSSASFARGRGLFTARASVFVDRTGEAVKALLGDVEALASGGLRAEEVASTRLAARSDFVESYEGSLHAAQRLARLAGVGLPPDHDAKLARARDAAAAPELAQVAARVTAPASASLVVVGPVDKVRPQLEALALGAVVVETAGGAPARPAPRPPGAAAPTPRTERP